MTIGKAAQERATREREAARAALRAMLPPGSRVATVDVNAGNRRAACHLLVLAAEATSRGRTEAPASEARPWADVPVPRVANVTHLVATALPGARRSRADGGILNYYRSELVHELSYALHGVREEEVPAPHRPGYTLEHDDL